MVHVMPLSKSSGTTTAIFLEMLKLLPTGYYGIEDPLPEINSKK